MQSNNQVSYSGEETIINILTRKKWIQDHPQYKRTEYDHNLTRPDKLTIFRLRTGHTRLRSYIFIILTLN